MLPRANYCIIILDRDSTASYRLVPQISALNSLRTPSVPSPAIMFRSTILSLFSLLTVVSGNPTPILNLENAISERAACSTLPPSFVLAGDSTTAVNGGWGTGFISFLKSPAKGTNIAKSGATTVSFVNGGYWKKVIDQVKADAATHNVVVTIQVSCRNLRPSDGGRLSYGR